MRGVWLCLEVYASNYFGAGWEDPVTKTRLYRALEVTRDDASEIAEPDIEVCFLPCARVRPPWTLPYLVSCPGPYVIHS